MPGTPLKIEQALDLAMRHQQDGRFDEAESIYRQLQKQSPDHPDVLHLSGLLAFQRGRANEGLELIRRAVELQPAIPEYFDNLGQIQAALDRFDEAIASFEKSLALEPDRARTQVYLADTLRRSGRYLESVQRYSRTLDAHPDLPLAHHGLGMALLAIGRTEQAVLAFRKAIQYSPKYPQAYHNLGNALMARGQLDEAIRSHRQAVELAQGNSEAHKGLGVALLEKQDWPAAEAALRRALSLFPNDPQAATNLGLVLAATGRLSEAIFAHQRAVKLAPKLAEAHNNLGIALASAGRLDKAIAVFRQAIQLRPKFATAHCNLAGALCDAGQLDQAIAACRTALSLFPRLAEAHYHLGRACRRQGQLDAAEDEFAQAIQLNPRMPEAHDALAACRRDVARVDDALVCHDQAIALRPDDSALASHRIYTLLFHPDYDDATLTREQSAWNDFYAAPISAGAASLTTEPLAGRRLRIGLISPDFRQSPISCLLLPFMESRDPKSVEIVCYSTDSRSDPITQRIRKSAGAWRDADALSDADLAEKIRADHIDVLVDLSMHAPQNRLLTFARKPAPVQVTWLAYPGLTGLATIDYSLTDRYLDPPSDAEVSHEEPARLPETWICYDPLIKIDPRPPRQPGSPIVFGSLADSANFNDPLLRLWAALLQTVPDSRLLLQGSSQRQQVAIQRLFESHELDPTRLEFLPRLPRPDYLGQYHRIDIALDTLPKSGIATTCDALWMGVPVLSLTGHTPHGRAGLSILSNLALPELAAPTPEAFLQIAAALAADTDGLNELHSTLRLRMEKSPLMDLPKFTADIEHLFRRMVQRRVSAVARSLRKDI